MWAVPSATKGNHSRQEYACIALFEHCNYNKKVNRAGVKVDRAKVWFRTRLKRSPKRRSNKCTARQHTFEANEANMRFYGCPAALCDCQREAEGTDSVNAAAAEALLSPSIKRLLARPAQHRICLKLGIPVSQRLCKCYSMTCTSPTYAPRDNLTASIWLSSSLIAGASSHLSYNISTFTAVKTEDLDLL